MKTLAAIYHIRNHKRVMLAMLTFALVFVFTSSGMAKVLFLAHFNDGVNADYALGSETAGPAPRSRIDLTELTPDGRWGSGLDLGDPMKGNCTFQAAGNLDPLKGTVDFWYRIDQAGEKYNPIFCWYVHEGADGSGKTELKTSGFELYRYGQSLVFAVYEPYAETTTRFDMDLGNWHHMEINWDCSGGDGASVYNVYLDGRSVVRMTDAVAFKAGGGYLHPGLWDHAWSGITLRGHFDELRVTDQVEHLSNFTPPTREYMTPATVAGVKVVLQQATQNLEDLQEDMINLSKAHRLAGDGLELNRVAMECMRIKDDQQAKLQALREQIQNGILDEGVQAIVLDLSELQTELDQVSDTLKAARLKVVQATGELYQQIPALFNQTLVNLGYLKDELEGFKRARFYAERVTKATEAGQLIKLTDKSFAASQAAMNDVSAQFYNMFHDSAGGKRDPVAAIPALAANRKKSKAMRTMLTTLSQTGEAIETAREALKHGLQTMLADESFRKQFGGFEPFIPKPLPPLIVEADGTLERLVYGGPHGRTETMSELGFDTL